MRQADPWPLWSPPWNCFPYSPIHRPGTSHLSYLTDSTLRKQDERQRKPLESMQRMSGTVTPILITSHQTFVLLSRSAADQYPGVSIFIRGGLHLEFDDILDVPAFAQTGTTPPW